MTKRCVVVISDEALCQRQGAPPAVDVRDDADLKRTLSENSDADLSEIAGIAKLSFFLLHTREPAHPPKTFREATLEISAGQ